MSREQSGKQIAPLRLLPKKPDVLTRPGSQLRAREAEKIDDVETSSDPKVKTSETTGKEKLKDLGGITSCAD
jgi:hypothetical protein